MTAAVRFTVIGPWLLAVALFVLLLAVVIAAAGDPAADMDLSTSAFVTLIGMWAVLQATVGTVIVLRRPTNRIGRLMQLDGPLIISVFLGFLAGALATLGSGPPSTVAALGAWWGSVAVLPTVFFAIPFLAIVFPDGRLPSSRWRWPVTGLTVILLATSAFYGLVAGPLNVGLPDNPFGVIAAPAGARGVVGAAGTLALVTAFAFAIIALSVRWRHGDSIERAQLKWLLVALMLGAIAFTMSFGNSATDPSDLFAIASAAFVPIAIGIAVLRYRLFEIDRLISRTLGWATVTGVLVVVFAAGVVGLQALLGDVTQGETLAVAASTLVAFALFQPVRRRVQRAVDRQFDRGRYDGERMATAFAERMRDQVDLVDLEADIVATVGVALRPSAAGLWLRTKAGAG